LQEWLQPEGDKNNRSSDKKPFSSFLEKNQTESNCKRSWTRFLEKKVLRALVQFTY
jgi:hypothetical protein